MKNLICVSYPRSGSHFIYDVIIRLLNKYKTQNIKYFCCAENESLCNTVPCTCNKACFITKTHDLTHGYKSYNKL
jgi:hypothetical protein